ncbi:MAG TPA: hypothetical protein VJZ71_12025 [Phycisphaerae bacterium]|nr:hypothetical protein [Phycisphaerae bacterium]
MYLAQVLLLACLSFVAAQHPALKPASQPAEKQRNELRFTPWRTSINVAVYQTTLAADRVDELDPDTLRKSAVTMKDLKLALQKFGETKLINLTDQYVSADSEQTMQIGVSRPVPSGSQTFKGQTSTQVEYQDTGLLLELKSRWSDDNPTQGMIDLGIEISCLGASQIQLSPGSMAPIMYQMRERLSGPVRSGEPMLLLNIEGGNQGTNLHAYVTRVVFHRTQVTQ